MNDTTPPIIEVKGLTKKYFLGQNISKDYGLRHLLEDNIRKIFKPKAAKKNESKRDTFLAVNHVSFSIPKGEVVGIIGHNGAGKSTLLKLLSRITEPTDGQITLRGRVASLLEVGTGFHPELTGRENIYLNGAILGMSRAEIMSKFDEIVAFAEVEKFLDTPVKRYSSGMYVRLAFAVAAHLEPEILIVDEVLAVGDSAFQKKCLGKMEDVAGHGRTVLFVSHNLPMVANLCTRGILLKKGQVIADGPIDDVIHTYTKEISSFASLPVSERTDRSGSGNIKCTRIEYLGKDESSVFTPITGQPLRVRLHYECQTPGSHECRAGITIRKNGAIYMVLSTWTSSDAPLYFEGKGYVDFLVEKLPLTEGDYEVDCFLEASELYDVVGQAANLTVIAGDYFGTGRVMPSPYWKDAGVLVEHTTSHQKAEAPLETSPV